MGEVIKADFITKGDLPADYVIEGAKEAGLKDVVIIGRLENDDLFLHASSGDVPFNMWLLAIANRRYIEATDT